MSKESEKIINAWQRGETDKRNGKPYINPYNRNSERHKYKAYNNGYNMAQVIRHEQVP